MKENKIHFPLQNLPKSYHLLLNKISPSGSDQRIISSYILSRKSEAKAFPHHLLEANIQNYTVFIPECSNLAVMANKSLVPLITLLFIIL